MKKGLVAIGTLLLGMLSVPVMAEDLPDLDLSKVSGYYYTDDVSVLLMPNGIAYSIQEDASIEQGNYQAIGDVNNFIVFVNDHDSLLYFQRQTEKEGIIYAIYGEYIGMTDEISYKEGKQVLFEDYIFDNDYEVATKDSLASFFDVESSYDAIPGKVEGPGYDTPEGAASAFIEALKAKDVNQMQSTFAVETYAENFDLNAYVERLSSYHPNSGWTTNTSEFGSQMNTITRQQEVLRQIHNLYMILIKAKTHCGDEAGNVIVYNSDKMTVEEYISDLFPDEDRSFDVSFEGDFIEPAVLNENYEKEVNQQNIMKQSAYYRAEDCKSLVASLSIDQEKYLLCMDVAMLGGKWYVANLSGNIGILIGLSTYDPGLFPISDEKYSEISQYLYKAD